MTELLFLSDQFGARGLIRLDLGFDIDICHY